MHLLTIFQDGAPPSRAELPDGTYVIGSSERCRIRLPAPGVSERHAILTLAAGAARIEDMGSDTGTRVNAVPVGRRPVAVTPSTLVSIGPYTLTLAPAAPAAPEPAPAQEQPPAPPVVS